MSATDKLKLWFSAIVVLAVIYFAAYSEQPGGIRLAASAVGLGAVAAVIYFSQPGRDFFAYVRAAGVELRKVVWPNKQETARLTGVVALFLLAVTLFLWLLDIIINFLLDQVVA